MKSQLSYDDLSKDLQGRTASNDPKRSTKKKERQQLFLFTTLRMAM